MDKEQVTTLDFLRHGEPLGGRRFRGNRIDDPLSQKGWEQMWGAVGQSCGWDRLISSPMQRCSSFARALQEKYDLPLEIEEDLREVGFGAWEGKTPEEIINADADEYERFYTDPVNNRPFGAEPLHAFGLRVAHAFDQLARRHVGQHLLVVAHAGVIRAALGHVLKAEPSAWYRAKVDNAAITRFQINRYGSALMFHNLRGFPQLPEAGR